MKPKYRKTMSAAVIKAVEDYVEPCRTIYIARQGIFVYYGYNIQKGGLRAWSSTGKTCA